jgi:hypothetical protein
MNLEYSYHFGRAERGLSYDELKQIDCVYFYGK